MPLVLQQSALNHHLRHVHFVDYLWQVGILLSAAPARGGLRALLLCRYLVWVLSTATNMLILVSAWVETT